METKAAVGALGALSQETRLAIFRLLVRAGPAGVPAGKVAAELDVPPATLSFHLTQLARVGLVRSRQQGRFVIYTADFAAMTALLAYLTEDCCGGTISCRIPDCAPETLMGQHRRAKRVMA
jgi:ArsR family transcriptional regulator